MLCIYIPPHFRCRRNASTFFLHNKQEFAGLQVLQIDARVHVTNDNAVLQRVQGARQKRAKPAMEMHSAQRTLVTYSGGGRGIFTTSMLRPLASVVLVSTSYTACRPSNCNTQFVQVLYVMLQHAIMANQGQEQVAEIPVTHFASRTSGSSTTRCM